MKKCFAIALFVIPVLFAFTGDLEEGRKSRPEFSVEYCKPDASIKKNQAKIEFTFSSDYYGVVKDSILMSYNGISKTLFCDTNGHASMIIDPGKYKFQFWLNSEHAEIYTDTTEIKAAHCTGLSVIFSSSTQIMEVDKPVIYVYPDKTQSVNIQLNVQGKLGFTYPAYYIPNNSDSATPGWSFIADRDGTIHRDGKEYEYLFWDARIPFSAERPMETTGFIVERDSLTSFFEKNLTAMGLNARERQDFITYWCPLMQKYEKSFVHFKFNEDYNSIATINITPKPDNLFRVFMTWEDGSSSKFSNIKPQIIPSVKREGFTVVEWGGADVSNASCRQDAD